MPAEPALTPARPEPRFGGGASRASGARLEQTAALLAPLALIVAVATAGGGYDVTTRHIAALAVWLVVVGLLVFGAGAAATLGRPIYWSAGLLGGLALVSAISSLWSGSVELSVIEADRVLAYLGIYLAAFLIAQTDQRRQRFAEGLGIAFLIVALMALGSRLLPHVIDIGSLGEGARLYYPLEYWNADGTMFGIAVGALLWTSRGAALTALRWISVAAMPAVLLALYFTFSRGGLLALLITCRDPDRSLAGPPLADGDAGDRRARRAARRARGPGSRQPLRQPRQPGSRRPGGDGAADPAGGNGAGDGAVRRAADPRAAGRGGDREGDRALTPSDGVEGGGGDPRRDRDRRRDRGRRQGVGPIQEL